MAFATDLTVRNSVGINTKMVQEGEIKSAMDVLNPKWKGKIIAADVRTGDIRLSITSFRLAHGDDAARKLLTEMDLTMSRDARVVVEGIVRGRFPVAFGVRAEIYKEFVDQGVASDTKMLSLPDTDYVPRNCVFMLTKAPHSSAAKLFINWILTKQGQEIFTKVTAGNSPRSDVPPNDPARFPKNLKDYKVVNREEEFDALLKTDDLLKQWGLV
jgi:ABC-type Fe3+ transport system substrate-binding protein